MKRTGLALGREIIMHLGGLRGPGQPMTAKCNNYPSVNCYTGRCYPTTACQTDRCHGVQ